MPYIDKEYIKSIQSFSSAEQKRLEFLPDAIPYALTHNEYADVWAEINNEQLGNYLYTNGYQLERVSAIKYAWENIKGFFGLENHCDAKRVGMTLRKLAYYGYVNGYDQKPIDNIANWQSKAYQLDTQFIDSVKHSPKSNTDSEWLQNDLVSYYNSNASGLRPSFWERIFSDEVEDFHDATQTGFRFGMTLLASSNLYDCLLGLDPQDSAIIATLVNEISNSYPPTKSRLENAILPNTVVAQAYADRLVDNFIHSSTSWISWLKQITGLEKLMPEPVLLAAKLDSSLHERRKDFYIEFYVKMKNFDEAMGLILTLENHKEAIRLAKLYNIPADILEKHIEISSPLAIILIDRFATTNQFEKIYAIYSTTTDKSAFNRTHINLMAEYYNALGKELEQQCDKLCGQEKWGEAEALLKKCKTAKKIAAELEPNNEDFQDDASMHAFQAGWVIAHSPLYGDQRSNRLDLAIQKIEKAMQKSIYEHNITGDKVKLTLIEALDKRAEIAVSACLVDNDRSSGNYAEDNHKQVIMPHIKKAIACYQRIIQLNKNGDFPMLTAKAHFMIADIENYFDIEKNSYDYRKAMILAPANPFYVLRCAEIFKSEEMTLQSNGVKLLKQKGLTVSDYKDWYDNRWVKIMNRSDVIDCHRHSDPIANNENTGWLSYLGMASRK